MAQNELILEMSIEAPPVKEQLKRQGFDLNNEDVWQDLYDSVLKLSSTNILTETERENILKKLLRGMYNDSI